MTYDFMLMTEMLFVDTFDLTDNKVLLVKINFLVDYLIPISLNS